MKITPRTTTSRIASSLRPQSFTPGKKVARWQRGREGFFIEIPGFLPRFPAPPCQNDLWREPSWKRIPWTSPALQETLPLLSFTLVALCWEKNANFHFLPRLMNVASLFFQALCVSLSQDLIRETAEIFPRCSSFLADFESCGERWKIFEGEKFFSALLMRMAEELGVLWKPWKFFCFVFWEKNGRKRWREKSVPPFFAS